MSQMINYDGELLAADQPVIAGNNRAFKYGDGLFESIRVVNGRPTFLEDHIERIASGAEILHLNLQSTFTADFFRDQITNLLEANSINQGGRIRLSLFRKSAGLYTPETDDASYIIEAHPLSFNYYALNEDGLKIDLYEERTFPINKLSTVKSNNALPYVLAGIHKREHGLDECILLNTHRNLSETISSNLFVVFNGVLYTPSIDQGFVPGIMRKQIIRIANENRIEVQETSLRPDALLKADEILLTNSITGIKWVLAYRNKRYFNDMAKQLVGKLNEKVG